MLALAQFAAGVAHDLNNHLTGILGFATVLSRSLAGQPAQAHLAELHQAAERAASLAREMQAFGRQPAVRQHGLDLVAATRGVLDGARHRLPPAIPLVFDIIDEAVEVQADALLLAQGLLDLLPQVALVTTPGGRVTLTVRRGVWPMLCIRVQPALISAASLARRCRPFAEPKSVHGRGLVLAAAWAALHHAGGQVGFRDEDGGLVVEIVFAAPANS